METILAIDPGKNKGVFCEVDRVIAAVCIPIDAVGVTDW